MFVHNLFKTSTIGGRLLINNTYFAKSLSINSTPLFAGAKPDPLKALNIPERPKRPLTPYIRFFQENLANIQKEHPNLKGGTSITSIAAQAWKNVKPEVKDKYMNQYNTEMVAFKKINEAYKESLTDEQMDAIDKEKQRKRTDKKKRVERKEARSENKPKRPQSALIAFAMDCASKQNIPFSISNVKEYKEKYEKLLPEEKAKYVDEFTKLQQIYNEDLYAWELKMMQEGKDHLVRDATLKEKRPLRVYKKKVEQKKTGPQ